MYDLLITESIQDALLLTDLVSSKSNVDSAEAAEHYSRLMAMVLKRVISAMPEKVDAAVYKPQWNPAKSTGGVISNVNLGFL